MTRTYSSFTLSKAKWGTVGINNDKREYLLKIIVLKIKIVFITLDCKNIV